MKILPVPLIKALDKRTIETENIPSHQLMERASQTFVNWFVEKFPALSEDKKVYIFCGIGHNGGDGLVIARLLSEKNYPVKVFICEFSERYYQDFHLNYKRLEDYPNIETEEVDPESFHFLTGKGDIIIDAIWGSGLNRPVENGWANVINILNLQQARRVSVDIPSGLFADKKRAGATIKADYVLSFELPKLAFFFPENEEYVGEWEIRSIDLDQKFIEQAETKNYFIDKNLLQPLLQKRTKYSHKGTYGHALIAAGSYGKMGAAILCGKACLRSGAGLVTLHSPKSGYEILQIAFPEAMVSVDKHEFCISDIGHIVPHNSAGVGPGIGTKTQTVEALKQLLADANQPLVLDADALNILAEHPDLRAQLPKNSILTPHPKEFSRLFGKTKDNFARHELQRKMAEQLSVFIILKGANTCIATPKGDCYFNATGNPGMATAGSGDVLTGILTGLLAQAYSPLHTCLLGVYLHGLAGDLATKRMDQEALLASDIIQHIGAAFKHLRNEV